MGLDYEMALNMDLQKIEMPILDDPVIHGTIPVYSKYILVSFEIFCFWFTSIFLVVVGWTVLFSRAEFLTKPIKQNVR